MSEPIKYGYRALGGTFVVILMIIFGTIALAILAIGIILVGFSWLPYLSPEILEIYRILFFGVRITDPAYAFLLKSRAGMYTRPDIVCLKGDVNQQLHIYILIFQISQIFGLF